jgi:spore coat polysaccharide biosynthesis protein SpsF (cytidylyltransferase family)
VIGSAERVYFGPGRTSGKVTGMRTVVILQARTTSTRLPGKALLPIAGYPSAVLGALRASNRGHETLAATSNDPSDDELAGKYLSAGIRVFRGPLDDVLARYYLAAAELPDDCIVIRLTGDNVVPDGAFVGDVASAFANGTCEYLAAPPHPCGLGCEAFSAATLRLAHRTATSPADREHVGLWMKRNCKSRVHSPLAMAGEHYSALRCTLDDQKDYQRLLRLFEGVANPVEIGLSELMDKLWSLERELPIRVLR